MNNLINEIEDCLLKGCIKCALGMALTLPDICGQIEFPNESVGKRYKKWCDNFLFMQGFFPEWDIDKNTGSFIKARVIDSDSCYALRCAFLHSGNLQLDNTDYTFHLLVSSTKENGVYYLESVNNSEGKPLAKYYDARQLCRVLCNAAMEYYNNHPNKKLFEDHTIIIEEYSKGYASSVISLRENRPSLSENQYQELINDLSDQGKRVYTMIINGEWNEVRLKLDNQEVQQGMAELLIKEIITFPSKDSKYE